MILRTDFNTNTPTYPDHVTAHNDTNTQVNANTSAIATKLDKSGGTLTGPLILSGTPTTDLQAATKAYVDSHAGGGGGASVWGELGGTLADQTDLQSALNAKLSASSNLSDIGNAGTARSNLGLGSIAVQNANGVAITGGAISGITDLAVADGGTGASGASGARTNLGLVIGADVEGFIAAGLTSQFYRGDKTWQDLNGAVRLNRLDQMAAPAAAITMNGQRITSLGTATAATDAVTKSYVDGLAQGFKAKAAVRVATTAALPTNTYSALALTATANGALTVDTVTPSIGDRILVKNEATGSHNGIYDVTDPGDASHPYILTRASDMDASAEILGAYTFVSDGAVPPSGNKTKGFVVVGAGPFTLDTTAIPWTQVSQATDFALPIAESDVTNLPSDLTALAAASHYTNATATPVTLGGIAAGATFTDEPVSDIIEALLYPYQAPAYSSFLMVSQATTVEVGTSIGGSKDFSWATSNSSNFAAGTGEIIDSDGSTSLASGLNSSGTSTVTPATVAPTSPTTRTWTINGEDTNTGPLTRNFVVTWLWKLYSGTSANAVLTENQIEALTTGQLLASPLNQTYALAASNYKYLCFPDSLSSPSLFTDLATGIDVAMADSTDHANYSNTANGYSYALVSVTNTNGVTTNYRVYRTKYTLGGSINLRVT